MYNACNPVTQASMGDLKIGHRARWAGIDRESEMDTSSIKMFACLPWGYTLFGDIVLRQGFEPFLHTCGNFGEAHHPNLKAKANWACVYRHPQAAAAAAADLVCCSILFTCLSQWLGCAHRRFLEWETLYCPIISSEVDNLSPDSGGVGRSRTAAPACFMSNGCLQLWDPHTGAVKPAVIGGQEHRLDQGVDDTTPMVFHEFGFSLSPVGLIDVLHAQNREDSAQDLQRRFVTLRHEELQQVQEIRRTGSNQVRHYDPIADLPTGYQSLTDTPQVCVMGYVKLLVRSVPMGGEQRATQPKEPQAAW